MSVTSVFRPEWPPAIDVLTPEDALGIGLGSDLLVVDDEESNLLAYEAALAPLGRRLVLVDSGTAALSKLLEQDFALMLLDVSMPDMTGLETARLVRQRARTKGMPIVFITGRAAPTEAMLEAYEVGAFDFVVKPVLPEILRAKASVYLQLQERTQAMLRQAAQVRELQARLPEASPVKEQFLAMLGHELRNPLAAIVSALDVLKMREREPTREVVILDRQIDHLKYIVDGLVDLARVTRGHIALTREAVEISLALAIAVDAVRPIIDKRRHTVISNIPHGMVVDADRHRLSQVLTNLLMNAAQYTAEQGRIEISAAADADGVHIAIVVRDNGRGITAELLPNVFEVFVQGERSVDRTEGGMGIGLSFAKTLVELHGGKISAHSDGAGAGATFTVRWPKPG